jgi:two-component system sensor histidine kinase ChvG
VLRRWSLPPIPARRIYDRDGVLILDSRNLYDVLRFDLPPPTQKPGFLERAYVAIRTWFSRGTLPLYRELGPQNGKSYGEVGNALQGFKSSMVRINERGEVIVSVAVPVQRFRAVRGALMLSTQGRRHRQHGRRRTARHLQGVPDRIGRDGGAVVPARGHHRGPVRRLAESAQLVRRRIRSRVEIPDLSHRRDEIGHLSGSLRDMTDALYSRIEAIESFAADVAHELKNPLTSLRSAVETLPLAKTDNSRGRLLEVIQHDVKRLDRLISDISDASRLDAEMQRNDAHPVNLVELLTMVTGVANERHDDGVKVALTFEGGGRRLHGARARFPARAGHRQPDRQCALVLAAGAHGARHLPAIEDRSGNRCRRRRTGVPAKRSRRFSSASTPTGRIRTSARIPASVSRSPSTSSRPMAAASGWRTAPACRSRGRTARVLGARFIVRLPAM